MAYILAILKVLSEVTAKDLVIIALVAAVVYLINRNVARALVSQMAREGKRRASDYLGLHLPTHVQVTTEVHEILDTLMMKTNADRIFVWQFHNGGANLRGVPFAKFSMTHERCVLGVEPMAKDFQNIPLPLVISAVIRLTGDGVFKFNDIHDLKTVDVQLYYLFKTYAHTTVCLVPLRDLRGNLIGCLGLCDILRENTPDMDKRVELAGTSAVRISTLLGVHHVSESSSAD